MQKLTHQEILSSRTKNKNLERLPVCLLADNIRSLYNVGSLFRLADGARLERILLAGITGTPPQLGIRKTALGADECVPWEYHVDSVKLAKRLSNLGYQLVVLEHVDSAKIHWEINYQFPLCLIVGNEVSGVRSEIVELADYAIEVPMKGEKNSLNVAMAAGVAVYEMVRQYAQLG
ncbi:MAG: TrmH family RNA methyltransferase [Candidatus Omnitrophica bacterium]|nr:TrmH family RNA methyltransferase [Candidatus Omnitrophota bacterium]